MRLAIGIPEPCRRNMTKSLLLILLLRPSREGEARGFLIYVQAKTQLDEGRHMSPPAQANHALTSATT